MDYCLPSRKKMGFINLNLKGGFERTKHDAFRFICPRLKALLAEGKAREAGYRDAPQKGMSSR